MSEEDVQEDIINGDNPVTDFQTEVAEESDNQTAIPDKYQGKSLEDIIAMHQNAEKELSRQGNELGETRKINDRLLETLNTPKPVQEQEQQTYDWDYEPDKAAAELVSKEVGAIKNELDSFKQQQAVEQFKAKYPNFEQDASSQEFLDWVQSSQYRTNLYQRNHNGIDLVAAEELMLGWADAKNTSSSTQEQKRQEQLKAATMEKGASSGSGRKKIWDRKYIRELMRNDPATYKAQYDEIQAAYAEGRVK